MTKMPLVSVIIPTYNREKTIKRAVESVLNQTYQNIECIVVDDCSNDNTYTVIKSVNDSRLKYIKQPKNSGACAARNRGIDEAKGEYIAFQDSDDEFRPEKIEKQLQALLENDADVVFCAMQRHGYGKCDEIFPDIEQGFQSHHDIVVGFYVSTQMIIGKKCVFEKYKFDENMPRMQDYDLMVRVAQTEKVYFLKQTLVDVYLQDDSLTPKKGQYKKQAEITGILLEKYKNFIDIYPDWYLIMLNRLALSKTMMGENATALYKELYGKEKNNANRIKYLLSKLHLLRLYYKLIDKR